jgi:hypothetical protein
MALTLNTQKAEAASTALKLNLQKAGIPTPPALDMAFVLDVSGSFKDEHEDGTTTDLLTRLVPWGLTFDPDKKLDVVTFSNGPASVHAVGAVNVANYEDYVRRHIVGRVPGWCGGTDYSFAIEHVLQTFGWTAAPEAKRGFFARVFGGDAASAPKAVPRRSLVVFVTDGENSDKKRTIQTLDASEQRGDGVYFLFLGVSNQPGTFGFIEELGERFGNVGFVAVRDLARFVALDDDGLNRELIGDELLNWLRA